ncbi:cytidylate kinase family protein [Streptomyces sp. SID3343]|uniref:cytidylate kinase family protein n=1 Tax=Streptomyces sp. SID3343 TaxID=2690260 RepID=UPI00136E8D87|nr:cytidylate kinase family protein [Streptomyces sp. SID3343]MYW01032.1 uridylate kinase [Streptomyces sp. SID3343]
MQHGTRDDLLGRLATEIGSVTTAHPLRVAIDGPPGAGKTTLADELAAVLRAQGRKVVRATIDDFLFPRAQRYRRGQYSAEGCYFDAHDRDAMRRVLLDPLGPDGDRRFRTAIYQRETDTTVSLPVATAPADAVLLFDGVFLHRPELLDRWDLSIFVAVEFDRTLERAQARGTAGTTEIERSWRDRYIPSQQLYFAQARPIHHADIIVNNDELQRPAWEVRPHRSTHKQ